MKDQLTLNLRDLQGEEGAHFEACAQASTSLVVTNYSIASFEDPLISVHSDPNEFASGAREFEKEGLGQWKTAAELLSRLAARATSSGAVLSSCSHINK